MQSEAAADVLNVIYAALEAKGPQVLAHALLCAKVARKAAEWCQDDIGLTPTAAFIGGLVHDIGKLYVPDSILNKQDSLNEREWETVRLHTIWGKQFLDRIDLLREYSNIALCHHELPDGSGYPFGCKGETISKAALLVGIADRVAALKEDRSYRRGVPHVGYVLHEIEPFITKMFNGTGQTVLAAFEKATSVLFEPDATSLSSHNRKLFLASV